MSASDLIAPIASANRNLIRRVLDNGIILLIKEDRNAPLVSIQIWVGSGSIDEGRWLGGGLSHFVEHMIFKGTPTRKPGDITREINQVGGEINAYTSHDRTVFHCTLPAAHWKVGLDVLADALQNATFPEEEWQRERDVILREMNMNRDNPDRVAGEMLWETVFRVHPYRVPIIGYKDVFVQMTREDLLGYFRQNYTPDNMIVAIVGSVTPEEAEEAVRSYFGSFQRRARPPSVRPSEPPQLAHRWARKTGSYELSRLHVAFQTVPLGHSDTAALNVLATVTGQGRSSRLVRHIKEDKRLVHDIAAWAAHLKEGGLFCISAVYDPEKEAELLEALNAEIESWQNGFFEPEEVEKAVRMVLVSELTQLETTDGQASSYASGEFYEGDPRYAERYLAQVAAVTTAELVRVANEYLREHRRSTVILAPSEAKSTAPHQPTAASAPISRHFLSNGIPVIVREDPRLPLVDICIAARGGQLLESENQTGLCHMLAEMLVRGTRKRSADELARQIELLGATLSPFAGRNSFGLQGQALNNDLPTVLELMAECLFEPAFPEEEIEKQRTVQIAAIRSQYERPFFVAEQLLRDLLYPNHPYRWSTLGREETVARFTRSDLQELHSRVINRSNLAIAIFGNVTKEQALSLAEMYFGKAPEGSAPALFATPPAPTLPARAKKREPREQTIVLMGFPGVTLLDPRLDALDLLDTALSGLSSDLGMEVRERRGLAYFVGSAHWAGLAPGSFILYAGIHEHAVDEVLALMEAEIQRVTQEGLREDEFARARDQRIAAQHVALQMNGQLAQSTALNELYGLGYDFPLKAEERLRALTREQVREAAASVLRKEQAAVAIVLPAAATETEPTDKGGNNEQH